MGQSRTKGQLRKSPNENGLWIWTTAYGEYEIRVGDTVQPKRPGARLPARIVDVLVGARQSAAQIVLETSAGRTAIGAADLSGAFLLERKAPARNCAVCGRSIPSGRSHVAKTCGDECSVALMNRRKSKSSTEPAAAPAPIAEPRDAILTRVTRIERDVARCVATAERTCAMVEQLLSAWGVGAGGATVSKAAAE